MCAFLQNGRSLPVNLPLQNAVRFTVTFFLPCYTTSSDRTHGPRGHADCITAQISREAVLLWAPFKTNIFLCHPVYEPKQDSFMWNVLPQEPKEAYLVPHLGHLLGKQ